MWATARFAASVVVERVGFVVARFGVGAAEHAIAFDVGVEPGHAVVDPVAQEVDFFFVRLANEHVGPHVLPKARPTGVVTDLGRSEHTSQGIDHGVDRLVAPHARAVVVPHAPREATVIGVLPQAFPPERMQDPTPGVGLKPCRVVAVAPVGVAKPKVVVPPRTHHNFAAVRILLFVEVGAESVRVDVLGDFVGEIHLDERLGVDVWGIPEHGVGEVAAGKGVLERREVVFDVVQLQRMQVVRLRFVHLDGLDFAAQLGVWGVPPPFEVALNAVHLHDVPAGQFVPRRVRRQQRGDVHPVVVALDVLHEHVHPAVVAVDVQFAMPVARRVAPQNRPHLVDDGVANERLVGVRAMQDPVVFHGQPHQRHVVVGPGGILGFQGVGLLGKELRGRAPDFDGDLAVVFVGGVAQGVEAAGEVGHLHVGHNPRIVEDGGVRGDLDQGQIRLVHVDARPVVLGGRVEVVDGGRVGAPADGGACAVRGALRKARADGERRGHVLQQPVVPMRRVGAILASDVFLAAPILARAVGERVVAREAVGDFHHQRPHVVAVRV